MIRVMTRRGLLATLGAWLAGWKSAKADAEPRRYWLASSNSAFWHPILSTVPLPYRDDAPFGWIWDCPADDEGYGRTWVAVDTGVLAILGWPMPGPSECLEIELRAGEPVVVGRLLGRADGTVERLV